MSYTSTSARQSYETTQSADGIRTNPFATKFVKPGAINFRFPPGESPPKVLERLAAHGHRGAIVGPHGSGKSTLLALLHQELLRRGEQVIFLSLCDGKSIEGTERQFRESLSSRSMILVDGWEQLSWLRRVRLLFKVWRAECGLIVTQHRSGLLPVLLRTHTSWDSFIELVRHDLGVSPEQLSEGQLRAAYERRQPDMREALFELYDVMESHARGR